MIFLARIRSRDPFGGAAPDAAERRQLWEKRNIDINIHVPAQVFFVGLAGVYQERRAGAAGSVAAVVEHIQINSNQHRGARTNRGPTVQRY